MSSHIIITAVSFFTTRVIKFSLGFEYLGLNGVFNNIISLLSLTELGIGNAIIFALYKPLAENDTNLISILMRFYRNAYRIIAMIVFTIGLIIMPFLKFFVNTTLSMNYVRIVFLLFVFNSSASYLLSYKRNIIFADQKNYIITFYTMIISIISKVGQLIIFYITNSFILYLIVNIICTIVLNILISNKANKLYPYLKDNVTEKLPQEIKQMLISKIKALFLHSIGAYFVFGTDNILISYFKGVSEVGLYGSYMMIVSFLNALVTQIFSGITSSVGNFLLDKSKEEQYGLYKKIEFFNSIIIIFISVCTATLITPFVTWWLGPDSVLPDSIVYLIILSNFITLSRNPIGTIKNGAGLFERDKYAPLIESFINLVVSCILAKYIGLAGIILGTIISSILVPYWVTPHIVYKYIFNKKAFTYFIHIILNLLYCTGMIILLHFMLQNIYILNDTMTLLLKFLITGIICILLEFLLFFKNKYFPEITKLIKNIIHKK
ncbi:MAG: hypothetical protein IK024_08890 [Treponema sp.]|nr:hypothetical protein [Treponema sp.]